MTFKAFCGLETPLNLCNSDSVSSVKEERQNIDVYDFTWLQKPQLLTSAPNLERLGVLRDSVGLDEVAWSRPSVLLADLHIEGKKPKTKQPFPAAEPVKLCVMGCAHKFLSRAVSSLQGEQLWEGSGKRRHLRISDWPLASLIVTLMGVVVASLLMMVMMYRYCCCWRQFWQAFIPDIG